MSIKSQFKKECFNIFRSAGFIGLRGNRFIRHSNGIIQVVEFQVSTSTCLCEVNWGVFPTSTKLASNDIFMCNHHLGEFENTYGWYKFDPKNDESIQLCVSNLKLRIMEWLIPFFENCISYDSTYHSLCEFEKATHGEILIADYSKGILAACFKDFALSALHFDALYQQHEAAMVNNLRSGLTEPRYLSNAKAELDEIKCLAECAHNSDEVVLLKVMRLNRLHIFQALPKPIAKESL